MMEAWSQKFPSVVKFGVGASPLKALFFSLSYAFERDVICDLKCEYSMVVGLQFSRIMIRHIYTLFHNTRYKDEMIPYPNLHTSRYLTIKVPTPIGVTHWIEFNKILRSNN